MNNATQPKSTRDAILDASDKLLAKYGYKKMSIQDLADEVGIGKGSIYLHFSSKEEIALSQIDRIIDRLKTRLITITGRSGSSAQRIAEMLVLRVIFRCESVHHYSQDINDLLSQLRPKLLERRKKYFEEEAVILAGVIAQGQRDSEFGPGDPLALARVLVTATNALLPYSLSAFELGDLKAVQAEVRAVADLLIRGLRN